MNTHAKKFTGATLLEILLVLAVIATVIILSVRYYQGAQASLEEQRLFAKIDAIKSAIDFSVAREKSYANVNINRIAHLLPADAFSNEFGGAVTFTSVTKASYSIQHTKIPTALCARIKPVLEESSHYSSVICAASPLKITYTYKK